MWWPALILWPWWGLRNPVTDWQSHGIFHRLHPFCITILQAFCFNFISSFHGCEHNLNNVTQMKPRQWYLPEFADSLNQWLNMELLIHLLSALLHTVKTSTSSEPKCFRKIYQLRFLFKILALLFRSRVYVYVCADLHTHTFLHAGVWKCVKHVKQRLQSTYKSGEPDNQGTQLGCGIPVSSSYFEGRAGNKT